MSAAGAVNTESPNLMTEFFSSVGSLETAAPPSEESFWWGPCGVREALAWS